MHPKPRMATDIPASITTPDSVETRLGTLRFFDGLPDDATVQKVYDNLDFQRAVQAYLVALPVANTWQIRDGYRAFGPDNRTLLMTESLMDSHTLYFVANTETVYNMAWLDTHDGPLVIEMPPNVLGFMSDFWSRYVTDVGRAGPDRGAGGRYVLLPPGYSGPVPDDCFVLRSRTYGNPIIFRGFMEGGDLRPAVENVKAHYRAHPLDGPGAGAMTFRDVSGEYMNTIPPSDASLFEVVATVVHEELLDAVDPETRGLLASIGIRKDAPFAPDARMQAILTEAAAVGNATARAIFFSTRDQDLYYYPGSTWKTPYYGDDTEFSPGGVLDLDARTFYFTGTDQISPALWVKIVGGGSQYGVGDHDSAGRYLDGGRTYRLHLPPGIPAKDFWSVLVYDPQTRSMLQTDQRFPSLSSQRADLVVNPDTSVDVYFGPEAPVGHESNWIQTIPGKGWFTFFRLYGPLEPWFDKTWRPGEIESVD
ncbi:MAG: DUF1254 domain-containing protein [Chloroflexota bacterium]